MIRRRPAASPDASRSSSSLGTRRGRAHDRGARRPRERGRRRAVDATSSRASSGDYPRDDFVGAFDSSRAAWPTKAAGDLDIITGAGFEDADDGAWPPGSQAQHLAPSRPGGTPSARRPWSTSPSTSTEGGTHPRGRRCAGRLMLTPDDGDVEDLRLRRRARRPACRRRRRRHEAGCAAARGAALLGVRALLLVSRTRSVRADHVQPGQGRGATGVDFGDDDVVWSSLAARAQDSEGNADAIELIALELRDRPAPLRSGSRATPWSSFDGERANRINAVFPEGGARARWPSEVDELTGIQPRLRRHDRLRRLPGARGQRR